MTTGTLGGLFGTTTGTLGVLFELLFSSIFLSLNFTLAFLINSFEPLLLFKFLFVFTLRKSSFSFKNLFLKSLYVSLI